MRIDHLHVIKRVQYLLYCLFVHSFLFFFFNDTPTTEIYTFPYTTLFRSIDKGTVREAVVLTESFLNDRRSLVKSLETVDRKSTRLNSSHTVISYAVFCLKKKTRIFSRRCKGWPSAAGWTCRASSRREPVG